MDGRKIRIAVRTAAESGYIDMTSDSDQTLPSILLAVNEIAEAATAELAAEAGYGEGARLATSRRAMLAAVHVLAQGLQDDLPGRVKDLRDEGVTWREIAELLNLTPEGAQRRFDPVAAEKAREASRRARQRRSAVREVPDTSDSPAKQPRRPRSGGSA